MKMEKEQVKDLALYVLIIVLAIFTVLLASVVMRPINIPTEPVVAPEPETAEPLNSDEILSRIKQQCVNQQEAQEYTATIIEPDYTAEIIDDVK